MWAEGATAKALSSDQARSMPPSVTSPIDPRRRIRAVLFDLDGTLYQQTPMRALMAIELMTIVFRRPLHAGQTWRTLAAYRKTQERLRLSSMTGAASKTQLHVAAERSG